VRAKEPDETGFIERDGVQVYWERLGDGDRTILFLPCWSIVHSRSWKFQLPYFSRHFRVLTFDPRGNGRSGRPADAAAYAETEFAADALAVLDATDTERAAIVGFSLGGQRGVLLAADHPERVEAAAFIGPAIPLAPPHSFRVLSEFDAEHETHEGWQKYNRS
jgi:pimeloyl-ACP methyl ester carboxylesterase